MSGLVWLALDGVGHPQDAPPHSPWEIELPTLRPIIDAGQALDARLGVEGLPQSATGQTSWLTGENAAAAMGHHYGPRPGPSLRPLLGRALPTRMKNAGLRVEILNFYPPAYFQRTSNSKKRGQHGCFPLSILLSGGELDPAGFPSVPPPLGLGFEFPWKATNALEEIGRLGAQVGKSAANADLILLDLWFSDLLGHAGGPGARPELHAAARAYLTRLDALLEAILDAGARVVISSDHGNFEDLRVKTHTLARVPFAGTGVTLSPARDIAGGGRAIAALFGL